MAGLEVLGSFKVLLRQLEEQPTGYCLVTVQFDRFKLTARGNMAYTLPVDHQVEVQVAYVDSKGNPATVDGDPVWASGNESVIIVTVSPTDPFKATIVPAGPVATGQVTVTADADLGEGVRSLVTLLDITTVAGEAVAGTITPTGASTPIPASARRR